MSLKLGCKAVITALVEENDGGVIDVGGRDSPLTIRRLPDEHLAPTCMLLHALLGASLRVLLHGWIASVRSLSEHLINEIGQAEVLLRRLPQSNLI